MGGVDVDVTGHATRWLALAASRTAAATATFGPHRGETPPADERLTTGAAPDPDPAAERAPARAGTDPADLDAPATDDQSLTADDRLTTGAADVGSSTAGGPSGTVDDPAGAGAATAAGRGRGRRREVLPDALRRWSLPALGVAVAALAAATGVLGRALVGNDFALTYVADFSRQGASRPYRLASLWGGMAGSLLTFATIAGFVGVVAAVRQRRGPGRDAVVGVVAALLAALTALVLGLADPFE